jgi:plasmid stability protein
MATIIIRNLDDHVAERLRLRARLNGVSVEEEARRVLADGTRLTRKEIAEEAAAIRARQKTHRSRAVDILRHSRDSRTRNGE